MESFFETLKVERTHRLCYNTDAIANLEIVNWIDGYSNHRRMHLSMVYKTPVDAEYSLMAA